MIQKKPEGLTKPFLIQIDAAADSAVETERKVRGLKSRAETIRALVSEGLYRAAARRKAGKPVEIGAGHDK